MADLTSAAASLKQERPSQFKNSDIIAQGFALNVFAYSAGMVAGPTLVSSIKVKAGWGSATLFMAGACIAATIPIVSFL